MTAPTTASSATNTAPKDKISLLLSDLPSYGAFTDFTPLPADSFTVHIPLPSDTPPNRIRIERTRCLIRALRSKPNPRKRPSSTTSPATDDASKRRRCEWATLERERKQACLKVALAAATRDGTPDTLLVRLKRGWKENPKKKQMVTTEVRKALCRSLSRWSVSDLREYLTKAGVEGGASGERSEKAALVQRVREHLAPEESSA